MTGNSGRAPVKIVVINTQYVETDELSFKSVVQELTGKDSQVAAAVEPTRMMMTATTMRKREEEMRMKSGVKKVEMGRNNSFLMRDLSFKELDRLLKEMPPVDELYAMWGN